MSHQRRNTSTFTPGSDLRAVRVALVVLLLAPSAGAGCPQVLEQYTISTAHRLPASATLPEVIAAVNENAANIQTLYGEEVKIKPAFLPTVSAKLAYEAPRRLRLVAETALTGTEFDLGSNDQLFWFWVRRSEPPALFYCRHDQFAHSAARRVLPIEPQWVLEALGLATIDPAATHVGPYGYEDGKLAVDTPLPRPDGTWTKTTVIDPEGGFVVEQQLRDPTGTLFARSVASGQRRDPLNAVSLPERIELEWPAARFSLSIELNELEVNYAQRRPQQLYALPVALSSQHIDLAAPPPRGASLAPPSAPQ